MSWQNRLDNIKFSIKTGDGKVFTPLWKNSVKTKEYNVSSYEFIDVDGSLITRKQPKGGKYPLKFWFQGDDNIDQAKDFEDSAADPRAWTVTHPFYGTINGQPLSLVRNDENYNVTELTVDFWESITEDFPQQNISIVDRTEGLKERFLTESSIAYAANIIPTTPDITNTKDANTVIAASFSPVLDNDNNADYQNALSKSLTAADALISEPLNSIESSQTLLDLPSKFTAPIFDRLTAFQDAFFRLSSIELTTPGNKLFYEAQAGACISGFCNASVNPGDDDYVVRTEIEKVVTDLLEMFNEYLKILDDSQVQIYDTINAWIPNVNTQIALYNLVVFTTGNLYQLAFDAKQERIVYTKKSTNVILLAHQYMGLDKNDDNLNKFIQINNIKLIELFRIKKGRQIKYFV